MYGEYKRIRKSRDENIVWWGIFGWEYEGRWEGNELRGKRRLRVTAIGKGSLHAMRTLGSYTQGFCDRVVFSVFRFLNQIKD